MAQVTHVLDTSALLAHAFQEPGWERVREILRDEAAVLGLSAAVLFEFQVRLQEKCVLDPHPDTVAEYERQSNSRLSSGGPQAHPLRYGFRRTA